MGTLVVTNISELTTNDPHRRRREFDGTTL